MSAVPMSRIAVAIDGSENADAALDYAIELAGKFSSRLSIVAVVPLVPAYVPTSEPWVAPEVPDNESKYYRELVDRAVERARTAGLTAEGVCLEGVIVDELLNQLEQFPVDLLVMGSRGLSTARRLLLGSVSDAIVHHVKCPVLIVKQPKGAK